MKNFIGSLAIGTKTEGRVYLVLKKKYYSESYEQWALNVDWELQEPMGAGQLTNTAQLLSRNVG